MTRTAIAALAAAALAATGCNEKCPTETPRIQRVQSCTAAPGQIVNVRLETCPTCNQAVSSCEADLSELTSGAILLDPLAESCDSAASCPSPSCDINQVTCSFPAPTTPGQYTLLVPNGTGSGTLAGTLEVGDGPVSCAF